MSGQHGADYLVLSRREREPRTDGDLLHIHILDGATPLPEVALEELPRMVQALSESGAVLVVEYDGEAKCLRFYSQDPWLRAGRRVVRSDGEPASPSPKSSKKSDAGAAPEAVGLSHARGRAT